MELVVVEEPSSTAADEDMSSGSHVDSKSRRIEGNTEMKEKWRDEKEREETETRRRKKKRR